MEGVPRLPNEIMIKIIRECVKPFSIQVRPMDQGLLRCSRKIDHDNDATTSADRHCRAAKLTAEDSPIFTSQSDGLLVRDFATRGLEVLTGLPNVKNLMLVNTLFRHEVISSVMEKFNGCVEVLGQRDRMRANPYQQGHYFAEFASVGVVHNAKKLAWLKPRIKEICVDTKRRCAPEYLILEKADTPNLRRLIVQSRVRSVLRPFELSGGDDARLIRHLQNHFADEARWRFNIAAHRARDIEILGDVDISCWEIATQRRTGVHQAYNLKVDVTRAGAYNIKGRKVLRTGSASTAELDATLKVFASSEIASFPDVFGQLDDFDLN